MDGQITPLFKLIFLTVVALTVVFLAAGAYIGIQPDLSDQAKTTANALLDLGKAGVGSIFGLLGGKSL